MWAIFAGVTMGGPSRTPAQARLPERSGAFVRRWLRRLPSPFTDADRAAGCRCELSVLQAEINCTEVFDSPLHGPAFFESVISDQLDLGRPEKLQLVFGRVLRRRDARFRTRVSRSLDPSHKRRATAPASAG